MSADEIEDCLELRDPKVKNEIAASRRDYEVGRVRDAWDVLAELKGERKAKARKPRTTAKLLASGFCIIARAAFDRSI